MRKLVIPREKWARGQLEQYGVSLLENKEGCRCCVGHYLAACGVESALIYGVGSADDLRWRQLPEEARWLVEKSDEEGRPMRPFPFDDDDADAEGPPPKEDDCVPYRSEAAHRLYVVNDEGADGDASTVVDEADRETQIKAEFAKHNVEVEFV